MKGVAKLFVIGGILFAVSCGGEIPNEQMSSVVVSVSVNESNVRADTAVWRDTNEDGVCDDYDVAEDSTVRVTVGVTPIPNLPAGITPSPVVVERVEIVYTPADRTSPNLDTSTITLGYTIEPETTVNLEPPIPILSSAQKSYLINTYYLLRTNMSNPIYSYYVTLRFRVREVYSNTTETIERQTYMQVGDFGPESCS